MDRIIHHNYNSIVMRFVDRHESSRIRAKKPKSAVMGQARIRYLFVEPLCEKLGYIVGSRAGLHSPLSHAL